MSITKKDRWTEAEILSLPSGEYENLERKAGALLGDKDFEKDMAKAISALANSGGGNLIFGQKDDGGFDGLPEKQGRTPMREWLEQKLPYLVVYPLQDFRVHEVEPDTPTTIPVDTVVIVIEIYDSPLAPHQSAKDHLYYHRVGGHSKPAPHFYLETLRGQARFPNEVVVEAWFETVINPLLFDLSAQHNMLRSKQWFFDQRLQSVHGVESLDDEKTSEFVVSGNREQFFETYPQLEDVFQEREKKFLLFYAQVSAFYKTIRESEAIYRQLDFCTSPASMQKVRNSIEDTRKKSLTDEELRKELFYGTDEQFLDCLAQYTINKTKEISSDNSISFFWNIHNQRFLSLLMTSEAGFHENLIKQAVEALLDAGVTLAHLFEETRRHLSRQHGVPYHQIDKTNEQFLYPSRKQRW